MEKVIKIIQKEKKLVWDYDEEADVLYLSIGKPKPSVGIDAGDGVIINYDEKHGEVLGITILGVRSAVLNYLKEEKIKS